MTTLLKEQEQLIKSLSNVATNPGTMYSMAQEAMDLILEEIRNAEDFRLDLRRITALTVLTSYIKVSRGSVVDFSSFNAEIAQGMRRAFEFAERAN